MQWRKKWPAAGLAAMVLGAALVAAVNRGKAADDDEKQARFDAVRKIGKALEEKKDDAKKDAVATAKNNKDLGDVMKLFKPRDTGDKDGIGIGPKPGAFKPDGIGPKIESGIPKREADLKKQLGDEFAQMGLDIAAIAEIAANYTAKGQKGNKNPMVWKNFCEDMKKAGLEFAKASRAKDVKAVKSAALKVQASCNQCHEKYKQP